MHFAAGDSPVAVNRRAVNSSIALKTVLSDITKSVTHESHYRSNLIITVPQNVTWTVLRDATDRRALVNGSLSCVAELGGTARKRKLSIAVAGIDCAVSVSWHIKEI